MPAKRKRTKCPGSGRSMIVTKSGHYCKGCSRKYPKTRKTAPPHYQIG